MRYFLFVLLCCLSLHADEADIGLKRPLLTLTFDDGWHSQYENAWSLMKKYGYHGTFYIFTEVIGQERRMTKDEIIDLHKEGNEIGSHSITHSDLTTLSASDLDKELTEPKKILEEYIQAKVPNFAAPYGATNAKVIEQIKKYYQSNRSVLKGFNSKFQFDPYHIRVQSIDANTSLKQVEAWVDTALKRNLWLVLVYHQVENLEGPITARPVEFEKHLSIIKEKNIEVLTMEQALTEVRPQITK